MAAPVAVLIHSSALTFRAHASQALTILCSCTVVDFMVERGNIIASNAEGVTVCLTLSLE